MYSSVSASHPSALPAISVWSRELAKPRASPSSFTATCCGIPAATNSQMMARTPGRSSTTLGTSRSTRPSVTRLSRLIGLRGSGRTSFDVRFAPKADIYACAFDQYLLGKRCRARQDDPDFGELAGLRIDLD